MAKKTPGTALQYIGPNSGFDHDEREIQLVKDAIYDDLPLDHPIIANLIARQLLVPPLAPLAAPLASEPNTEL